MVLMFYRRFLWNQAVAMGLVKGEPKQHFHIDHSDKTFWKSLCIGVSCAFYWILAWQSLFLLDHPRIFYGTVFACVGACSISADTGLFRHMRRVMAANQLCDRWMATTGTILILFEIFVEFIQGSPVYGVLFSGVAALSFFVLQKARERVHVQGHDWGWVFLHCTWHFISVAGTLVIVRRSDIALSAQLATLSAVP